MLVTRMLMLVGLAIPAGTTPSAAQSPGIDTATTRAIDRYIAAKMRSSHIPGLALAIVKGDRPVYLRGYGSADESGRAVTPQTPFLIGSITKSFTALAILQLVDAGRVDLDAPVTHYIPWFGTSDARASSQITVRELLTMTSGLPQVYETQFWTRQDDQALEQCVRFLRTKEPGGPVGETIYSNANYETLGLIVQTVSGVSYEEYVKRHVFTPLDMRDSFTSQDEATRHGLALGHRWWFGVPLPRTVPFNRAELPAGYIIASAEDMSHFLVAEMNDGRYGDASLLSPAGMALRHTEPSSRKFGYGWEFPSSNGRTLINLDGGTSNSQASLFFDPSARVGVFIAMNVINALDAFASPHGASLLDGQTSRAMANVVLSMTMGEPLPEQGFGHERLTLIFNLTIVALTAAVAVSLVRIPVRQRRLERRGIPDWSDLAWQAGLVAVVNFALPVAVLFVWLNVPAWGTIAQFQPDVVHWLVAVALILFVKGTLELSYASSVFRRTRHAHVSPVPAHVPVARH